MTKLFIVAVFLPGTEALMWKSYFFVGSNFSVLFLYFY